MPRTTKKPQKETPPASKSSRPARRSTGTAAAKTGTKSTRTKTTGPAKTRTTKTEPGQMGNQAAAKPRRSAGNGTSRSETPHEAAIRERAFEIYEARGWSAPDHEVQDWLEAESQLLGKRRTR